MSAKARPVSTYIHKRHIKTRDVSIRIIIKRAKSFFKVAHACGRAHFRCVMQSVWIHATFSGNLRPVAKTQISISCDMFPTKNCWLSNKFACLLIWLSTWTFWLGAFFLYKILLNCWLHFSTFFWMNEILMIQISCDLL